MIPPHPTDDIRDFIRFCSHIPGPGDVRKRKGATPRQIEELWDLGGKEFPPFY